jgi:hypothetical protein
VNSVWNKSNNALERKILSLNCEILNQHTCVACKFSAAVKLMVKAYSVSYGVGTPVISVGRNSASCERNALCKPNELQDRHHHLHYKL